jgi:catechol 2,3-dioxygenase-like lactoylglutathione lyase family enzyme
VPRGLDHIVHAVRDLDAAAAFYRRAGFTVGARNRHPWGTHNHVVQLPGFFIELLSVAEPDKLVGEGLALQFGAFNRDAIARGDGFSMLLLESSDIEADASDFARSGIGCSPVLPFSREAKMPDGTTATVGFSLAFAREAASSRTGFVVCQQHNPGAFWNPAFQAHDNGACGVSGVVFVAEKPADYDGFLAAFTGVKDIDATSGGIRARTPRGDIDIVNAASFRDQFGEVGATNPQGITLAGLRLTVRDTEQLEKRLQGNGFSPLRRTEQLVIPPSAALGATLIFES